MLNLILKNVDHLEHYIDQIEDKYHGESIYVTVRKIKDNNYNRKIYFAKIGEFADKLGYTKSEMHEFIKKNVLPSVTSNPAFLKEDPDTLTSTTCLNNAGYTSLIQKTEEYILGNIDVII